VSPRLPGTAARIPALVAVGALVAGLIAVGQTTSLPAEHPPGVATAIDGPVVPGAATIDSTWYCAEGTSTPDGRADETVIIANLSSSPIDATVTVLSGSAAPPKSQRLRIEAFGQEHVPISNVLITPEPGVVVEIFGGPAVVEHELTGRSDIAVGACSRDTSPDWYFAGGTTVRGAEDWLALFNPYGDDAIVDLSFLTDTGFQAPGQTQAVTVPRHSRISVDLHDLLLRQTLVAIAVHARAGRVVAERTSRFDGSSGVAGLAVELGATSPARHWRVPYGDGSAGAGETLSVANFDVAPTKVSVQPLLDGTAALQPQSVDVPARGVVSVNLANRVPAGTGYAVDVRVLRRSPVVVEADGAWIPPNPITGVAASTGSTTTSPRWAFAIGRLTTTGDALISALNVSGHPTTVRLYAYTAGRTGTPRPVASRSVATGARAVFSMSQLAVDPADVLVVAANGPVVAGRLLLDGGASLAAGIPYSVG
jgi:hypothetical protein